MVSHIYIMKTEAISFVTLIFVANLFISAKFPGFEKNPEPKWVDKMGPGVFY